MDLITFDEFKNSSEYQQFMLENPRMGTLKVQVSMGSNAIPVEGAEILVTKDIGNNKVLFFKGVTDSSGMVDDIMLPSPSSNYDSKKFEIPRHTDYILSVIDKKNDTIKEFSIASLGDVKAIQNVNIIPNGGLNNGEN